jgi:hypothetical protein
MSDRLPSFLSSVLPWILANQLVRSSVFLIDRSAIPPKTFDGPRLLSQRSNRNFIYSSSLNSLKYFLKIANFPTFYFRLNAKQIEKWRLDNNLESAKSANVL